MTIRRIVDHACSLQWARASAKQSMEGGRGREGVGGGDNQAKLGITKLSEQRHNPTTLQNSRIRISRSSCIRIEHFQGFGCERSCKCTHLPTPRKIKAASAICWHSNPRNSFCGFLWHKCTFNFTHKRGPNGSRKILLSGPWKHFQGDTHLKM